MKKSILIMICRLMLFLFASSICFALGNGEIVCKAEEDLRNHCEVINYEKFSDGIYIVTLTENRTIEFYDVCSFDGGFYASIDKIGEYNLFGEATYFEKERKTCSSIGAYFIDLS